MFAGAVVQILETMQLVDNEGLSISATVQSEDGPQPTPFKGREWGSSGVPAILRPCPFPALFKQQERPKQGKQGGFSGAFNLSNKQIYHAVRTLRQTMLGLSTPLQFTLIRRNYPNLIRRLGAGPNYSNLGSFPGPKGAGPEFCRGLRRGKSESDMEQRKCKQRRIVVSAFCGRGFGEQALAEVLREGRERCKILKADYAAILLSAVTDTLRRMEQFLCFECHRTIRLLTVHQLSTVHAALLDCRQHFSPALCQVWLSMMRSACGIAVEPVSEQQVLAVYSHIQHLLADCIASSSTCLHFQSCYQQIRRCEPTSPPPPKPRRTSKMVNLRATHYKLHTVWRRQHQDELMELYQHTEDFAEIAGYFHSTYPHLSQHFASQGLKSRLLKLCEIALRKVRVDVSKRPDVNAVVLSEAEVKMVIHEASARPARIALLHYYRSHQLQRESALQKTVHCLREYVVGQQPKLSSLRQLHQSLASELKRKYHPAKFLSSANATQQVTSQQQSLFEDFEPAESCQSGSENSNSTQKAVLKADVSCLVSPQFEAKLVQVWLQPDQYQ